MPAFNEFLTPIDVHLDQVLLDPNNPRFAELGDTNDPVPETRLAEDRVQRDALERMKSARFDVAELRDTIKAVGYLPMDRIVIRLWAGTKKGAVDKYVVVEGNRRIAALKWLVELHETGRETFTVAQIKNFTLLPALILDDKRAPESTRLVLPGLRHVSGIKEWGPYQKARAVHVLRKSGQSPREVAQSLGLSTQAANQLWRSFLALEQMRADEEYGETVEPRMYSYFEEIMKRPNVRNWLGWNDSEERFTNEERTKELYSWIVGMPIEGEEGETRTEPKLPEAKSIRELSTFLDDETALGVFRSPEGTLARALSRYDAEHQQAWQGPLLTAHTTLASLTPDTLRAMQEPDIQVLQKLLERIQQVLHDRERLLNE